MQCHLGKRIIPIFTTPPIVTPPPPAGTPAGNSKSSVEKTAVAVKSDKKDLREPQKENEGKTADNSTDGEEWTSSNGNKKGVLDGVDYENEEFDNPFRINPPKPTRTIISAGEVTAIQLVYAPQPEYPPNALRLGMKGRVTVQMVIDENGLVESVEILGSTNEVFNEAVIKAVKKWRFTPPVNQKGQKVAIYYTRTIAFSS